MGVRKFPVSVFRLFLAGRILNRFSKDVGFLDDLLPYIFCEFILVRNNCKVAAVTCVCLLYS